MADVNLDRLHELAEKAADESWWLWDDQPRTEYGDVLAFAHAADPSTVKALIQYARRLEAALVVALDCKGSYGGTVSSRGGDPAICTKCEATVRTALSGLDGKRANGGTDD